MRHRLAFLLSSIALLALGGTGRAGDVGGRSVSAGVPDLAEARRRRDVLLPKLWTRLVKADGVPLPLPSLQVATLTAPMAPTRESPPPPAPTEHSRVHLHLEDAVETALRHNLPVQIARLTRDTVEYEIPKAKAIFHPTVGLAADASSRTELVDDDTVSDVENQDGRAFATSLVPTGGSLTVSSSVGREDDGLGSGEGYSTGFLVAVTQPLMRGGGIVVATRPIKDARYDLRVEEARLQAQVLAVIAAAKTGYYNLLLAEEIIRVTRENIERDKLLVEASQELLQAGMVTKRDLYSAQFLLDSDSNRLVEAEAGRETAENSLLDVLGIPIGTEVSLQDRSLDVMPVALELERWIRTAMEHRPEILEVQELLAKNRLDIRVSGNGVLPQLDVVGAYGKPQEGSTLARALDLKGESWTAGLLFSVPVGNVAARSQLAQANVREMRLERELLQRKRLVELEVRSAVIKLDRSNRSLTVLRAAIESLHKKLEVAQGQFSLGLVTNLDITDAQEDLLDTQTDLLTSLTDYNVGLAELEASIAGPL